VSDTAEVKLEDVNGDQKADLVVRGGPDDPDHGQIYLALATGTGSFDMWTSVSEVRVSNAAKIWVVDVDGDRHADLVAQGGLGDPDQGQIYVALSNSLGNGFEMWNSRTGAVVNANDLAPDDVWFKDIKGSRAAEMIYFPSAANEIKYFSHPIGISARDLYKMMVVNTRRVLEIEVPCR
jgi:hypothetical protein